MSVQSNRLVSIEELDNFTNLKYLYLDKNQVTKVKSFEKLHELIELGLRNNLPICFRIGGK
ncbi:MAG: leucine-rich repeat domain-containing protein [Opitutae bacterium]|nr:leucine-rich repeat domain-containing protein [Opitutae bacterium]